MDIDAINAYAVRQNHTVVYADKLKPIPLPSIHDEQP